MGWIGEKFAGLDALCRYYVELGLDASMLPDGSSEALEKGLVRKDMGYIKVSGRNFELVTIRMKGTTSGSYSLGGIPLGKAGGASVSIPLGEKQKIPFEYHHIVRTRVVDEKAFKAELKKKTKGLIGKEVVGVSWEGGSLAARLNSYAELNAAIMGFVTPQDGLKVEGDKAHNAVRVVFSRPSEIKSGLIHGTVFTFDRKMLPREAVEVIDKIAGLVR